MTGEELRKIVRNSDVSIADISKDSGIPEQTIYSLYKKPLIENHYVDKLKNTKLKLATENYIDPEKEHLKHDIKRLEDHVEFLSRYINTIEVLLIKQAADNPLEIVKSKKR